MPDTLDAVPGRRAVALDHTSPVPLYHQLRQALERSWRSRYAAEDNLPTEQDIMAEFQISRITVRRALDDMMADGVIYRPRPRGRLHLAPARVRQHLNRLRGFFSDDALAAGHHPLARVLEVGQGIWPEANRLLRLAEDALCYRVSRLHESDGKPLAHQVSFIPCASCPDLLLGDLSGSLLQIMEARSGRRTERGEQRLAAREVTKEEASLLQLPRHSYVFEIERVSYDERGEPIEYFVSVLDVARFEFHTSMDAERAKDAGADVRRSPWFAEPESAG